MAQYFVACLQSSFQRRYKNYINIFPIVHDFSCFSALIKPLFSEWSIDQLRVVFNLMQELLAFGNVFPSILEVVCDANLWRCCVMSWLSMPYKSDICYLIILLFVHEVKIINLISLTFLFNFFAIRTIWRLWGLFQFIVFLCLYKNKR